MILASNKNEMTDVAQVFQKQIRNKVSHFIPEYWLLSLLGVLECTTKSLSLCVRSSAPVSDNTTVFGPNIYPAVWWFASWDELTKRNN